jgi:hypothetical protein
MPSVDPFLNLAIGFFLFYFKRYQSWLYEKTTVPSWVILAVFSLSAYNAMIYANQVLPRNPLSLTYHCH